MARSEARLHFNLWDDLDELPPDGKLLYCIILSDRSVNHAGQGYIRADRWEKQSGLTTERVEKAMAELEREPHIAFDRTTGEFLIRKLIHDDEYATQPYLLKGSLSVAKTIESAYLRHLLAKELRKLPPRQPDGVSKSGKTVIYPDPHACADEIDPGDPGPNAPRRDRSAEGPERVSGPSGQGVETHLSLAPDPAVQTPSGKGLQRGRGGGGGGGGGSLPVDTQDPISASRAPAPARERLDVRAARLVGSALPRGIGRGARGELTAAVQRRLHDDVEDSVVQAALARWVADKNASARAIEWMLDDAIKESHGAVSTRRSGQIGTAEIFAAGSKLVAMYKAQEAAEAECADVRPIRRGAM